MKNLILIFMAAVLAFAGCGRLEKTGRNVVRKTGELAGKGATEFFSGVGEGIRTVTEGQVPDVLTAIATRKSVRKFDPLRKVDDATVEKILRAAMAAPSALDKRPWEFVVVRDPKQLAAIANKLPNSRVGNGAPLAIVVCGTTDNGIPGNGKECWIHDCSAASMNLLLAAPSGPASIRAKTALPPCARFWRFRTAICRSMSFRSAIPPKIRRSRTSGIPRRYTPIAGKCREGRSGCVLFSFCSASPWQQVRFCGRRWSISKFSDG